MIAVAACLAILSAGFAAGLAVANGPLPKHAAEVRQRWVLRLARKCIERGDTDLVAFADMVESGAVERMIEWEESA